MIKTKTLYTSYTIITSKMVKLIKLNDGTYNDLRLLMAKKKFEALEVADYVNCNITFDDLIKDLLKTYRNSLKNDFKQEMIRND